MTKLSEEKRKELDEQGREALDKLEENTLTLLDKIENFTLGVPDATVKDMDEVFKELKVSAKETRKISVKYRKHLEATGQVETENDTGEFEA